MKVQLTEGKEVKLLSAHGVIARTVVKVIDDVVCVCLAEEYELAKRQAREPRMVGFKMTDLTT